MRPAVSQSVWPNGVFNNNHTTSTRIIALGADLDGTYVWQTVQTTLWNKGWMNAFIHLLNKTFKTMQDYKTRFNNIC